MAVPLLRSTVAPHIPLAPQDYDAQYVNQANTVLRLYFNQLDNFSAALAGTAGGYNLRLPIGSFLQTSNVTPAAANTAYAITFNSTSISSQVALAATTSRITITYPGYYNFQYMARASKSIAGAATVWFWSRVNGVDTANSASKVSLTGGTGTEVLASGNFVLYMNANDYFELAWAADSTSALLEAIAASGFTPAVPAVGVTATFMSF